MNFYRICKILESKINSKSQEMGLLNQVPIQDIIRDQSLLMVGGGGGAEDIKGGHQ